MEMRTVEMKRMHPAFLGNRKAIEDWLAWNAGDISGDCLDESRLGDCTEVCFETLQSVH